VSTRHNMRSTLPIYAFDPYIVSSTCNLLPFVYDVGFHLNLGNTEIPHSCITVSDYTMSVATFIVHGTERRKDLLLQDGLSNFAYNIHMWANYKDERFVTGQKLLGQKY